MSYKVPFVDLSLHYQRLEEEIKPIIEDVLFSRADLIMRKDLKEFESEVSDFLEVKHAIGLNSGTDAIYFSLLALGIGKGDEVITVAHTFVATVAAIVFTGAKPVLVDVGKDHNMDPEKLKSLISPKTKAIIPVHLNGRICNMGAIMKIAKENDLAVVEDACQSWGACFEGKKAGSFGNTGCFSLYPMKILGGTGDGGVLVTDDDNIARRANLLRDHNQNRQTGEILGYGYNSRLDNFHAAILSLKLRKLPGWIKRRREIAGLYNQGLKSLKEVVLPLEPDSGNSYYDVYQNYVIRSEERDELVSFLNDKGIETLISWPKPMHHHKNLNLSHFSLPMTEQLSKEVVSLPMNTEINNEQIDYVINAVRDFCTK